MSSSGLPWTASGQLALPLQPVVCRLRRPQPDKAGMPRQAARPLAPVPDERADRGV